MRSMKTLILASNSPRRKEILLQGKIDKKYDFRIIKSNYKEESFKFYNESFIKKNSLYKALDVANSIDFAATVIGADTMVILDSVCLLKPQDFKEAFLMLKKLSGRRHKVVTSISLADSVSKKNLTEICESFVTFREIKDSEIERYLEDFKPFDKAGSYGIQDFGDNGFTPGFVEKIEGDYYNIMGISLDLLNSMLQKF